MASINDIWLTESTRLFLHQEDGLRFLPTCCVRNLSILCDSSTGGAPCSHCGVLFVEVGKCPSCGAPRKGSTECRFDIRGYLPEALVFVGLRTPFALDILIGWCGCPDYHDDLDVIATLHVEKVMEQVIPSLGIITADPPEPVYMVMTAVGSIEFRKER